MVKSKLSVLLDYTETRKYSTNHVLEKTKAGDIPREAQMYQVMLQGVKCLICLGKMEYVDKDPAYQLNDSSIVYFPIYLISQNKLNIKQIHARIGLFEFEISEYRKTLTELNKVPNDGDEEILDLDEEPYRNKKPLLFNFVTNKYLKNINHYLGIEEEEEEAKESEERYSLSDDEADKEDSESESEETEENWVNKVMYEYGVRDKFIIVSEKSEGEPANFLETINDLKQKHGAEDKDYEVSYGSLKIIEEFVKPKRQSRTGEEQKIMYYRLKKLWSALTKSILKSDDKSDEYIKKKLEMRELVKNLLILETKGTKGKPIKKKFNLKNMFHKYQGFNDILLLLLPELMGIHVVMLKQKSEEDTDTADLESKSQEMDDDKENVKSDDKSSPFYLPNPLIVEFLKDIIGDTFKNEKVTKYAFVVLKEGTQKDESITTFNLIKLNRDGKKSHAFDIKSDEFPDTLKDIIETKYHDVIKKTLEYDDEKL